MSFGKNKKLKTIAFDLDTKALQEHYKDADYHNAYKDLGSILNKNRFLRKQGSVYDSTTKFSDEELGDLIQKICEKLPWLPLCVKSIRGYDQPVIIDYTLQVKENFLKKDLQIDKKTIHKETTKEREKSPIKPTSSSLKTFLKKDDDKNNDKKVKNKGFTR